MNAYFRQIVLAGFPWLLALLAALSLLNASFATRESSAWAKLNIAGIEAARARNYVLTERCFQAAEKAAEAAHDEYRQELALINLAGTYALELKLADRRSTLLRLIQFEQANGESYDVPRHYLQIAQLEAERSEVEACRASVVLAIRSAEKEYGDNSLATIQVMNDGLQIMGGWITDELIGLWEKLADLQERQHLSPKVALLTLAYYCSERNMPAKVEACARRLEPILRKGSPELAELYICQAEAAFLAGQKEKGKKAIAQCLATIDEFSKPGAKPIKPSVKEELGSRLSRLGRGFIYNDFGEEGDCDRVFEKALELSEGRGSGRNLIPGLYGAWLNKTGRERDALALAKRFVNPEQAQTEPFASLEGMAICGETAYYFRSKNDLAKAILWAKRAFDADLVLKESSADFHEFQVVQVATSLANFYMENKQPQEAEKVLAFSLPYHKDNPLYGTIGRLAEAQFAQGKFKEAEQNFRLALESGAGQSAAASYRQGIEKCEAALKAGVNRSASGASSSSRR